MAKKKKSTLDSKIKQAQYKNDYLKDLKKYYDRIHPELYSRFSNKEVIGLFLSRGTLVRCAGDNHKLPHWITKYCNDYIRDYMHKMHMEIIPGSFSVDLLDYSYYLFPLEIWGKQVADKFTDCPWFKKIILDGSIERVTFYQKCMNYLSILLMNQLSDPAYQLCNIEYHMYQEPTSAGISRLSQQYKIKHCNPKEYYITYKKKLSRNGIELLYNIFHLDNQDKIEPFDELELPLSHFGIKTKDDEDKPLKAFILRHALNRIEERLGGCLMTGYTGNLIIESLLHGKVTMQKGSGNLLVEYLINDVKAGYLVVDVSEGVILVRTFLFLTSASTPEGKKLREHFGLQKDDIKYFNLDKLSTVMESDLLTDEKMCEKLRAAGCESLIDLYNEVKNNIYWSHSEEQKALADTLRKYMMEEDEVMEAVV